MSEVPRVIPVLLLDGAKLVKTVKFREPRYVGDPRNAVKIFNEKEVDELLLLDIAASPSGRAPQFDLVQEIVSEAFMPVGYGGGVRTVADAARILNLGVEKVVICTAAVRTPTLVEDLSRSIGSQSVVVCLNVRRTLLGRWKLAVNGRRDDVSRLPSEFAREMEQRGAGELIVNSIDRDGTMTGYDLPAIRSVADAVSIPVVASGGAGALPHFAQAIADGGASAAAAGSMFVFHGPHRAVLIQYPERADLERTFQ